MRISRKQLWMGMAELAAKRSTCFRGNVGCVIVHNDNPIALGYNGPPSGDDHCKGTSCETTEEGGCLRSLHAEDNAVARLDSFQLDVDGFFEMFVTSSPCPACANIIIRNGRITKVYYQSPYRITMGIEELINAGIKVFRFSPSGYLVEEETGLVLEAN